MKLSVFTVATPDLSPEELAAVAARHGIDGIEWRYKETAPDTLKESPSFWGNNRCTIAPSKGDAELDRFRKAAEAYGRQSISVTPYLQAGDLEATEQVLSAAKRIGASMIRLGVPSYDGSKSFGELFKLGRAYLQEAEKLCRLYGVKGLIETHHVTIAASASAAYRLVEGLDADVVGVLFDPGNMVHEGFENYRMGMELLGPYLAHVHVKNAAWRMNGYDADGSDRWQGEWKGLQRGMVPWPRVIKDLVDLGYNGYLGVEDFSGQFSTAEAMLQHFSTYIGGLLSAYGR